MRKREGAEAMTELKTTSIMLTVEQWERLRDEAHETRRSQSEIVREALEMRWARKEKEEKKMKTYWIDECIVTPEGKLLPRGFELHIEGETARIVVPSDVPGDKESLYEEKIQLSQETFAATYENGTPVHVDDGETIGFEREISIVENDQERWEVRMTHNYMDARQIDENGNPMEDWEEISWSIFCENHGIDTDSF